MTTGFDHQKISALLREVGQTCILPFWKQLTEGQIRQKTSPTDIVTEADLLAERILSRRLRDLLPCSLVLGEEGYAENSQIISIFKDENPVWIIDPIDGTLQFTRGQHDFGTMVALVQAGEILAGWVYHPATDDLLMVENGSGAYFNDARLSMLPSLSLTEMYGILGMDILPDLPRIRQHSNAPSFDNDNYVCCAATIALLTDVPFHGRTTGAQHHFRAVAKHCMPWDDAANALAVRESGGEVINWAGHKYQPDMMGGGVISAPTYADCLALRDWLDQACDS